MPESILYMRNFPSSGQFDPADPEMAADMVLIAAIDPSVVELLSSKLRQADGFLHTAALRSHIKEAIQDQKTAQAVLRALQSFEPDDVERVLKNIDRVRKSEPTSVLNDADMSDLRRNLVAIVQIYPALANPHPRRSSSCSPARGRCRS